MLRPMPRINDVSAVVPFFDAELGDFVYPGEKLFIIPMPDRLRENPDGSFDEDDGVDESFDDLASIKRVVRRALRYVGSALRLDDVSFYKGGRSVIAFCAADPAKGTARLRFNEPGWRVLTPDERLDTILHEVAHAIHTLEHGDVGSTHGPEWRAIAQAIGCTGDRCLPEEASQRLLAAIPARERRPRFVPEQGQIVRFVSGKQRGVDRVATVGRAEAQAAVRLANRQIDVPMQNVSPSKDVYDDIKWLLAPLGDVEILGEATNEEGDYEEETPLDLLDLPPATGFNQSAFRYSDGVLTYWEDKTATLFVYQDGERIGAVELWLDLVAGPRSDYYVRAARWIERPALAKVDFDSARFIRSFDPDSVRWIGYG
jgi:hypothetical protein